MIDEENHPRMLAAQRDLFVRSNQLVTGRYITPSLIHDVQELIADHRIRCRQNGIDFPQMVILSIPRLQALELVRADLEEEGIRRAAMNFRTHYPAMNQVELAEAFRGAFQVNLVFDVVDASTAWLQHQQAKAAARREASRDEEGEDRERHFLRQHNLPERRDH